MLSRYHSNVQSFRYIHGTTTYVHGAIPQAFCSPLLVPLCLPFVSPLTYLAPSSCDRNRPPRSQVACKRTPFAPPFTQPTPSLQIPRTPTAQRLTKTTSGIFLLLLSGTPGPNRRPPEAIFRVRNLPRSCGRDQMNQNFSTEIFCIQWTICDVRM
jgi:hypothetical protein